MYEIGQKIICKTWRDLKAKALALSGEGYGVEVIGWADMSDNILTITALPEQEDDELLVIQNEEGVFEEYNEEYDVTIHFKSAEERDEFLQSGVWIPVKKRLPEEGINVLLYAERNAYGEKGRYKKKVIDIGWHVEGAWHIDNCNGVRGIAWMTLPEPYEEEEE